MVEFWEMYSISKETISIRVIFGGSTVLVKHIYRGNFASKVLWGSEMVLFPGYITLDGIAGFGFFHLFLQFYWEFVTCPFHCVAQINTRLFFSFPHFLRINFRLLNPLDVLCFPLKLIGYWIQVLSVLHIPGTEEKWLYGVAWSWGLVAFIMSTLNLRYRWS